MQDTTPPPKGKQSRIRLEWDKDKWVLAVSAFGTMAVMPVAAAGATATAAGWGAFAAGAAAVSITSILVQWARSNDGDGHNSGTVRVGESIVRAQRKEMGFDPHSVHVAVCGPCGSGKSTLLNSLRGLHDSDPGAAKTGCTETTADRSKYASHASLGNIVFHDFPGAGTGNVPAAGYYQKMQLYLYDQVFILHGQRFGEIEIELVKCCIRQGQRFTVIRSHSDTAMTNIAYSERLGLAQARERYMEIAARSVATEIWKAGVPEEAVLDLMKFFVLVNRSDLLSLVAQDPCDWCYPRQVTEIHEREFLRALGKAGVTLEMLGTAGKEQV